MPRRVEAARCRWAPGRRGACGNWFALRSSSYSPPGNRLAPSPVSTIGVGQTHGGQVPPVGGDHVGTRRGLIIEELELTSFGLEIGAQLRDPALEHGALAFELA